MLNSAERRSSRIASSPVVAATAMFDSTVKKLKKVTMRSAVETNSASSARRGDREAELEHEPEGDQHRGRPEDDARDAVVDHAHTLPARARGGATLSPVPSPSAGGRVLGPAQRLLRAALSRLGTALGRPQAIRHGRLEGGAVGRFRRQMRRVVELGLIVVEQILDVVAAALRLVELLLVRVPAQLGAVARRRAVGRSAPPR